jgi:hypothetical protein
MEENWNLTKKFRVGSLYFHSVGNPLPIPTSDLCYPISVTHQIIVFIIDLCY